MIQAKLSQTIDFNLSDSEAKDITIKYICSRFNWKPSYRIRFFNEYHEYDHDWVVCDDVAYSSHSFKIETKIRKASDTDKIVYQFLQEITNT